MSDQQFTVYDRKSDEYRQVELVDNGDGTFSMAFGNKTGINIDVLLGDQYTDSFDAYFGIEQQNGILLTSDVTKGDRNVLVSAGHGFVVGSYFVMSKPGRIYTGEVVDVVTNTIKLDTLIPDDFLIAETQILRGIKNLIPNGSFSTPVIAKIVIPQFPGKIDITRIMHQITTTNPPEWDQYGDQTKLVYGVCLRVVYNAGLPEERIVNLFNIKDNSEIALHSYDVYFIDGAGPLGANGLVSRSTWGGQNKRGVVIRLTSADELQLLFQDAEHASLLSQHFMVEGHIVID